MEIQRLAEQIDKLMTLDLPFRGVIDILYPPARKRAGEPLAMRGAKELSRILKAKDIVLIATGWPDRPHISPEVAETDGPPGAAALGRALHRGLKVTPFFLIEENLVGPMGRVVQSAGFRILSPREAIAAAESPSALHAAAVLGFPTESERAREKAISLMETFKPTTVIAIEKGGMNEKGIVHTSRGHDTTEHTAKVDFLMREATHRKVWTLGIGDGGNEIGMGNIREEIRRRLPFGDKCLCPCGSGISPVTQTDLLVTATVSNWGAYGISACLAILLRNPEILHDPETERRILEHASQAGFIDGINGFVEPGADGLQAEIHCQIISLLSIIVKKGCSS